jgi:hypothetical protein
MWTSPWKSIDFSNIQVEWVSKACCRPKLNQSRAGHAGFDGPANFRLSDERTMLLAKNTDKNWAADILLKYTILNVSFKQKHHMWT